MYEKAKGGGAGCSNRVPGVISGGGPETHYFILKKNIFFLKKKKIKKIKNFVFVRVCAT